MNAGPCRIASNILDCRLSPVTLKVHAFRIWRAARRDIGTCLFGPHGWALPAERPVLRHRDPVPVGHRQRGAESSSSYRGRLPGPRLHFATMARCDRRLTHPLLSSWQGNFNANAADIARQLLPQLKGPGSKHVMYRDMGRDGQKLFSPASSPARWGKWYPAIVPVSATARRSQVAKTLGSHLVVFAAKSLAVLGVTGCWCIAG